ncbi:tetratricopeptide repeat protein [Tabrizicola sp.]|uniref:tetratricopeptide repeat protein n=1 Tax=Tabrizicola sp. TaxID=2005166 RepID=UPI003F36B267
MKTLSTLTTFAAMSFASVAFAAGSDSTEPPVKTQTTEVCENGQIWDEKKKECVNPQSGALSDDALYEAARELAYDGQYDNALKVLAVAEDQNDPRILNYKGFANRKAGRMEEGMAYYQAALAIDPDYILARSYMGQALVSEGDFLGARDQLLEIEARGGRDTWAYAALEKALLGEETTW